MNSEMEPADSAKRTISYRPDIDGLRGLAVLAVVLFHAQLGLRGGFVGVDVFFVISGYLITAIMMRQMAAGTFSVGRFFVRRTRRLAPALVLMVIATLAASLLVIPPSDLRRVGQAGMMQAASITNFLFYNRTDYFAGAAEQQPLLHTWSLAVEMQFYVLLLVVMLLVRAVSMRLLRPVLWTLTLASFAWSCHRVQTDPMAAFFLLPSRAWELFAGSLLATVPSMRLLNMGRQKLWLMGYAGITMIVAAIAVFTEETFFPGPTALLPVVGTALVIASSSRAGLLDRFLCSRPLVGLGLISYSLYLWHWPILAVASCWWIPMSPGIVAAALLLSLLVGYLSWRFVETPLRSGRAESSTTRFLAQTTALQAIAIGGGFTLSYCDGFPDRMPADTVAAKQVNSWASAGGEITAEALPRLGVEDPSVKPSLILLGDSHGGVAAHIVDRLAAAQGLAGYSAVNSHPRSHLIAMPGEDDVRRRNADIEAFIIENEIRDVIVSERWEVSFAYRNPADKTHDLSKAERAEADAQIVGFCDRLAAAGCRVHLLGQVPRQESRLFRMQVIRALRTGEPLPGIDRAAYDESAFWRPALQALAQRPNVSYIDVAGGCFGADGSSRVIVDGRSCYFDDDHLSKFGAETLLGPVLAPSLSRIAAVHHADADRLRTAAASDTVVR